ncbi:MAG: hypothetical protein HY391_01380, partial [Deltaproteobacteria bacterium]|nr:hypothetical protein [Deltaproteobacteria bacterium]
IVLKDNGEYLFPGKSSVELALAVLLAKPSFDLGQFRSRYKYFSAVKDKGKSLYSGRKAVQRTLDQMGIEVDLGQLPN